jgi:hypothetical protein
MKTFKLPLVAFILLVTILAIFFLISSKLDQSLPEGASGGEGFMNPDSIVNGIMGNGEKAPPEGVVLSDKTNEQIKAESELLAENTKKAIEKSEMKSLSCEEIFQQYAKVMDDCFIRDNCGELLSFNDKDIAFTRCREKSRARYDSLELKYR